LVKIDRGALPADPHKYLIRWKNFLYHLLNIYGAGDIRQNEMHTVQPFVPQLSASEFEFAIGKVKDINLQVLIRFQQN
jgi:hypothetical protein